MNWFLRGTYNKYCIVSGCESYSFLLVARLSTVPLFEVFAINGNLICLTTVHIYTILCLLLTIICSNMSCRVDQMLSGLSAYHQYHSVAFDAAAVVSFDSWAAVSVADVENTNVARACLRVVVPAFGGQKGFQDSIGFLLVGGGKPIQPA